MNLNSIRGWDALLACSLIVIAGCIAFTFVVPMPSRSAIAPKKKKAVSDRLMAQKARKQADVTKSSIVSQTWDLSSEALEAKILTTLTELGARHHLEVSHFTVARPTRVGGLIASRSVVTFSGSFSDVVQAMREIERPDGKLVITDVKIDTGTRQGSDSDREEVSAIFSVASFIRDPERYAEPAADKTKLARRDESMGEKG
jgi:hypothetical protein